VPHRKPREVAITRGRKSGLVCVGELARACKLPGKFRVVFDFVKNFPGKLMGLRSCCESQGAGLSPRAGALRAPHTG